MAERIIVGDTPRLGNSFTVAGVLTDPTTLTLAVVAPDGTSTTYTYPATLSKTSTGVYYKDLNVTAAGVWLFTWTAAGTVADVEDGSITVWPTPSEEIDVLTLIEAKQAVGMEQTNTTLDDYLQTLITAVSAQLDQICGPIRNRAALMATDGTTTVTVPPPVYSITTVTEYNHTTATVLTAETNTVKTSANYMHDGITGTILSGTIRRRSSGSDYSFPPGRRNVEVLYIRGRAPNTDVVPAKFKQAASVMLLDIWRTQQASGSQTFANFVEEGINPLLGPGMLNKVAAFLGDDMIDAVRWVNA